MPAGFGDEASVGRFFVPADFPPVNLATTNTTVPFPSSDAPCLSFRTAFLYAVNALFFAEEAARSVVLCQGTLLKAALRWLTPFDPLLLLFAVVVLCCLHCVEFCAMVQRGCLAVVHIRHEKFGLVTWILSS